MAPPSTSLPDALPRRSLLAGLGACALGCAREDARARGRQALTLWFSYGGKNRLVFEELVEQFNATQNEIFVRAVFQGDYYEALAKLRVALAARSAPALSHVVGEVVPYLSEASVLDRFDRFSISHATDVLPALGQSGSWTDGASHPLVALPFNRSTPIAYINGKLFADAGLSAPQSWDELRETARALTRKSAQRTERYGFGCPVDWWFWAALTGQAGGELADAEGNITLGGNYGLRALEFWRTLVVDDGSMKPPAGRDYNAWEQTNQDFLAGRVAMIWTSTAFLKYLEENAKFPLVAAPLPRKARRAVPSGGTHWVLLRSAPEDERRAAARFVDFMLSREAAASFATRTGYIPVTRGALDTLGASGFFSAHPNWKVAIDQLADVRPWPWSPRLFRVQREVVQPRLERAIFGGGEARALIAEAQKLALEG